VSGFSPAWLALREPYDLAARNTTVLRRVTEHLAAMRAVSIVDLACGTGSTFRALHPLLGDRQKWRLVDNNLSLLARTPRDRGVSTMALDIARDLEAALDGPIDLVTTSALLDLVSEEWLDRFAVEAAVRRLPVYAALSYDGRAEFSPHDPFDDDVMKAVNAHQCTDKGFGPALGPAAGALAVQHLRSLSYEVEQGSSDWRFSPHDVEVQREALGGWALAAGEMKMLSGSEIAAWLERRNAHLHAGRSSITVGHVDFFAVHSERVK
jgi:hypothetical protein